MHAVLHCYSGYCMLASFPIGPSGRYKYSLAGHTCRDMDTLHDYFTGGQYGLCSEKCLTGLVTKLTKKRIIIVVYNVSLV